MYRLTLLIVILILGGCETIQAIDKSLYSVTNAVTQTDRVTGLRTLSLEDRTSQIEKGNKSAEQYIKEAKENGKKINEDYDPIAYERIKKIFSRLHAISHVSNEPWNPILIEDSNWNAFTTGGTYFVINSALEADLNDDSELANVIAHEMGHIVANHVFEQKTYSQLNSLAGSKSVKRKTFQAAFTHENESEADKIAILYCALAGFDPYAGERIWERMNKKSGNSAMFVHDHPMNSERAENAKKTAEKVSEYYSEGSANANSLEILKNNNIFQHAEASNLEAGSGGGLLALLESALTTVAQQKEAKAEEYRQESRIQFMQTVQRLSSIVSSSPIGPNTWRVRFRYNGNRQLTNLSFKLIVKDELELTEHIYGILRPGAVLNVDFTSADLDAYRTKPSRVYFLYDNARII